MNLLLGELSYWQAFPTCCLQYTKYLSINNVDNMENYVIIHRFRFTLWEAYREAVV